MAYQSPTARYLWSPLVGAVEGATKFDSLQRVRVFELYSQIEF